MTPTASAARCSCTPGRATAPWAATRRQVLLTCDADGHLSGGALAEPGDQLRRAGALLADPAVAIVQARDVLHGCYMLTFRRP